MLAVFVLVLLICKVYCNPAILPTKANHENDLVKCVLNIVEKYYEKEKSLTYIDLDADDSEILPALHESPTVSIISRKLNEKLRTVNEGYLINAKDDLTFVSQFNILRFEADWTPSARFVIIVEQLLDTKAIFNELLKLHVFYAILINGTNQADIYTYDPFKNLACGRYYDRVISYGPCVSPRDSNFFKQAVTSLRNCTFNIAVSHVPPFVIKPGSCKLAIKKYCTGTEQFIFDILGRLEHFKVNYTYIDTDENFSDVNDDMIATGWFRFLENATTDGLFGKILITHTRAQAFNYIHQHLAFTDQMIYIVKRSDYVPAWKYVYLEFQHTVWILFFLAFASSTGLLIVVIKPKNIVALLLKMWDTLFLHGFSVYNQKFAVKLFLNAWISFAFFMNSFYQSILMSLTTHPSFDFQISTEQDIINAKLRPCVIPKVSTFFNVYSNMSIETDENGCHEFAHSMETVSKSHELYTIASESVYEFNSALFRTKGSEIYRLKNPLMKAIFVFYFYKGFPLMSALELHALRLREHGLIDQHAEYMQYYNKLTHDSYNAEFNSRVVVPWVLLLLGTVLATFSFILEVLKRNDDRQNLLDHYVFE